MDMSVKKDTMNNQSITKGKKVNKNNIGILKFLDNTQVSMTTINSIILVAIFVMMTMLVLQK